MTRQKLLHSLGAIFGLILFAIVLWALSHELREYHYRDIVRHIQEIPGQRLAFALLLTIANYIVLTGHDALAFRYLHYSLSYGKIAFASFLGYAFSHNIGVTLLSGASMRYRLYSTWGLSAGEIATVVAFNSITFWFGILLLGGLVFVLEPPALPPTLHFPFRYSLSPLGVVFLILVTVYLVFSALKTTPLKIREWELPFPPFRIASAQVLISSLDWMLAASVLYVILPSMNGFSYQQFLGIFILAQIAGLSSQLPGGVGVFETVILLFLSPLLSTPAILSALIAYRGIYYLLPLGVATILLTLHELSQRQEAFRKLTNLFGRWAPVLTPQILALSTFFGGVILLLSGATPPVHGRMKLLADFVPLPAIELAHFLGSVAGVGLLLLARGLQQRLDAAYHLTIVLLIAGIAFSILKGFDYEEATILSMMLVALWSSRAHFYRQASLHSERFSLGWIVAIVLVLGGSLWLGMFAHKHVEYANDLWWQFALQKDAPRFLRATVGVLTVALFFAAAHLLRPTPPEPATPTQADLDAARVIIAQTRNTEANLALLGDKTLLFSESRQAFIMYGIEGRSWIALGDPIGPPPERIELAWQFRELCDQHGGWPVFYQVSQDMLPLYIDLGLTFLKLGEQARVDLATFSLKGDVGKKFRYTINRVEKEGCSFAVVPVTEIPLLLSEFRTVSDAWLVEKKTREKGFSLGFFSPEYLQRFPAGVIRQDGKIIAFANLWIGPQKEELSPDLMRHVPEAPPSVMEYLFLQLILWGKQEGYRWFNLGMAPLSGLEDRALAPLWNRWGSFVFRHGEHFYNFQGLRRYKEKFEPTWEPKYLAAPGGLALPRILTNLASLISGGLKGVIAK